MTDDTVRTDASNEPARAENPASSSAPPPLGAAGPVLAKPNSSTPTRPTPTTASPSPRAVLPQKPATPPPTGSEETPALKDDIAKILSEVKLPERQHVPGKPEEPKRVEIPTALGAKPVPAQPTPPAKTSPSPAQERPVVTPVHTLKDDLKEVVQEKKISVVRAVSLEEERRHAPQAVITEVAPQKPNRLLAYVFAILVMLALGAASLGGVYIVMQERLGEPPSAPATSSILFAESAIALVLQEQSPLDLKRLVAGARQSSATLGSITRIVPIVTDTRDGEVIEREATLTEFLDAFGAHAPTELTRALGSEFFFGLHTIDQNAPLLVIPVVAYDRAFAGMLAWEPTLNADLAPAFSFVPDQIFTPEGLPERRRYDDIVMRNYDVRALREAGSILFYYSFPSQRVLIIAESPHSFTEILSRLQAQRSL